MRLTKNQARCLSILSTGDWRNAQSDKMHLGSLNALSLKGLVEAKHDGSLLWRITDLGLTALAQSEDASRKRGK